MFSSDHSRALVGTKIILALDAEARSPLGSVMPLRDRRDGPHCGDVDCERITVHLNAWPSLEKLLHYWAIIVPGKTGFVYQQPLRRAVGEIAIPTSEVLLITPEHGIVWHNVTGRDADHLVDARLQQMLDDSKARAAVFDLGDDQIGLYIRRSLLIKLGAELELIEIAPALRPAQLEPQTNTRSLWLQFGVAGAGLLATLAKVGYELFTG